jgi:myo-inositol-1(or 4)-monophosphatase
MSARGPSVRETAVRAARDASRYLRGALSATRGITYKGAIDLVTDADLAAEQMILRTLREAFPNDDVLSEETAHSVGGARRRWVVDPLDGTTNFAHRYPMFAVSIAAVEDGHATVGVVALPVLNELFVAERGKGATLNGRPIAVSKVAELDGAFLVTGFPYDVRQSKTNIDEWSLFVTRAQAVRRDGAAAANMAYVACGRFDGFWEMKLQPWDVAAGSLLVHEAGGRITNLTGGPFDGSGAEVVASNGRLHAALLSALAEAASRRFG